MIPICMVTRNRHAILDVTLRSLSASRLPDDQALHIFDDASQHPDTRDYLYTDKQVNVVTRLPGGNRVSGFDTLIPRKKAPGLLGRVNVTRLGDRPLGVVDASCKALRLMTEKTGVKCGIVIVQDDVVFNANWLQRLTVACDSIIGTQRPVGLITGCWINKPDKLRKKPMSRVPRGGITAQCYYITPAGLKAAEAWINQEHNFTRGFDNKFCAAIRQAADVYRMFPAVCQHTGMESLVRPRWNWSSRGPHGRSDYTARGPYPLADDIRSFE